MRIFCTAVRDATAVVFVSVSSVRVCVCVGLHGSAGKCGTLKAHTTIQQQSSWIVKHGAIICRCTFLPSLSTWFGRLTILTPSGRLPRLSSLTPRFLRALSLARARIPASDAASIVLPRVVTAWPKMSFLLKKKGRKMSGRRRDGFGENSKRATDTAVNRVFDISIFGR